MHCEIGSEYHYSQLEDGDGLVLPRKGVLTFSGRTAIEAVLGKLSNAKTALLPSYCCDSMIEPFLNAGIRVAYYEVDYLDGGGVSIALEDNADILLWCNYFGFRNEMPSFDGVIIEDITHSLLSEVPCHAGANYLIASLRKWMPLISGGYCTVDTELESLPISYTNMRRLAMEMKAEYLNSGDPRTKPLFLGCFQVCNEWINENYFGLGIDDSSKLYLENANVDRQRDARRRNAHRLYEKLQGKVQFLFPEEMMDCPLFVPIVVHDGRDDLQRQLLQRSIYCPVHWPRPNERCCSRLYETELSLICDQRYAESDMDRIASAVISWMGGRN